MKIGLLTYYGDLNCGTNLQALASLRVLRKVYAGAEVEIIPVHGFTPPGKKPYLTSFTLKTLYNDFIRINKYNRFTKEQLNVKKDNIIKDIDKGLEFISSLNYDKIFVGSDTLLELDRIQTDNKLSLYWLSKSIKAEKYLLSASAKNLSFEDLSVIQRKLASETINDFSALGVRDNNTRLLLSHLTQKDKIKITPDPTFSLDIDNSFTVNYLKQKKIVIPKNSICFHTTKNDKNMNVYAKELKESGYTIFSLRPAYWADYILNDMSPLEQLGIYKYFSCVVTHRFHDSIFCIKNKTPFLLYSPQNFGVSSTGSSKFTELLQSFELEDLCYMHSIDSNLISRIKKCIKEFDALCDRISEKENSLKNEFIDFIKETK